MALIFYNNLATESAVKSVSNSGSGLELQLTPYQRMLNRSVLDTYQVTHGGTLQTNVSFNSVQSWQGFALIGCSESNPTVRFMFNKGTLLTMNYTHRRVRYINGEQRWDLIFDPPGQFNSCDEIEISWLNVSSTMFIGAFYLAAQKFDIPFEHPINYGFVSTGTKVRSIGGQVTADTPNTYMTAQFNSVKNIAQADLFTTATGIPLVDINYRMGKSLPFIVVPYDINGEIIYGTQSKPFTISEVPKPPVNGGLTYQIKFNLEEEL